MYWYNLVFSLSQRAWFPDCFAQEQSLFSGGKQSVGGMMSIKFSLISCLTVDFVCSGPASAGPGRWRAVFTLDGMQVAAFVP